MLAQLANLYNRKGWDIEDAFGDSTVFDGFCKTMTLLDDEECEMFLALTDKFLWVNESEYLKRFIRVYKLFVDSVIQRSSFKTIIISPLLRESDFGEPKSSTYLYYLAKSIVNQLQNHSEGRHISYLDKPSDIDKIILNDRIIICLIDDFIGSGLTVLDSVSYLTDHGVDKSNIAILGLVSMENGVSIARQNDINIYSDVLMHKGISGTENEEKWTKLMSAIESRIGVADRYRFGFERSESLVKMIRTPNNTFPIYWWKNKINKMPPFVRV